jgi:hypothetical protein
MSIFKKTKETIEDMNTELKFDKERLRKNIIFLIRTYRDSKIKPPDSKYSRLLIEQCDKIDPEHKLSERDIVDKLMESDIVKTINDALNDDILVPDEVIKGYIDKFYEVLRGVMASPDPHAYDDYEYQSQQLISILSLKKMDVFKSYLKEKMDSDPACPYFLKKVFLMTLGSPQHLPSDKDEETAEEIMSMVCPGLQAERPEVFRALVDSLKWRGKEDLQRTLTSVKKTSPEKRHLRGRESCIFIETDENVHYVG